MYASLPEPTLRNLDLIKVSDWYGVGLQLELDDQDLGDIKKNCCGDNKECRREMFRLWLKTSPNPTYAQLAKALVLAEEETLAHRICQKYGESNAEIIYIVEIVNGKYLVHSTGIQWETVKPSL